MQHALMAASMTQRSGTAGAPSLFATFPALKIKTYAKSPVWSESVQGPVKWAKITRKQSYKLLDAAWQLVGTAITHADHDILRALCDFHNYRTGQCDPSYEGLAKKAKRGRATVARALERLSAAGLIAWLRRCEAFIDDAGRFCLQQGRNAYALLARPEAPAIVPDHWGQPDPVQSVADITAERLDATRGDLAASARALKETASLVTGKGAEADKDRAFLETLARFMAAGASAHDRSEAQGPAPILPLAGVSQRY